MCDKNGNAVIYTSATHGDNLLSNDGLSSGNSRQHWSIQVLADVGKSVGPFIASRGRRLPNMTNAFICSSLIASNYPSNTQIYATTTAFCRDFVHKAK